MLWNWRLRHLYVISKVQKYINWGLYYCGKSNDKVNTKVEA